MSSTNSITPTQVRRLKHLEAEIRQSANTMGANLTAIHDEGLYKSTHTTWESYCLEEWGMSGRRAKQLIQHGKILLLLNDDAGTVVDAEIGTIVLDDDPDPQTDAPDSQNGPESDDAGKVLVPEAATRELAGLPEDVAKRILQDAVGVAASKGKKRVTAKDVLLLREEWGADSPPVVEPEPEPTLEDFIKSHNKVVSGLMSDLLNVLNTATEYGEGCAWLDHNRLQELKGRVESARNTLRAIKAAGPCPYCEGGGCEKCRTTGFVNKTTLEAAPKK